MTTPRRIQLGPHAEETSADTLGGRSPIQKVSVGRPPHAVHFMQQHPRGR